MPKIPTKLAIPATLATIAVLMGIASFQNMPGIMVAPKADAHGSVASGGTQNIGDLLGYAWSSNFGWISFSCENDSSCGAGNWGVTVDTTSGNITGYAWSSNVGWINFGSPNLTGCGVGATEAVYDAASKRLRGYARVVSLSPPVLPVAAGGADGCINLDPGAPVSAADAVQVKTYVSGPTRIDYFDGYAWDASIPVGGPAVGIGWIDFCASAPVVCARFRSPLSATSVATPWVRVNGSMAPVTVTSGDTVTIEWWSDPAMTTCRSEPNDHDGFTTLNAITGTDLSSGITSNTSFRVSCVDGTGTRHYSNTVPVSISTGSASNACSNGLDDDGDGKRDFVGANPDPGCSDANDDDERDTNGIFTVSPMRVRAGGKVKADWDVTGGGASACELRQSNGGTWAAAPLTGGGSERSDIIVANSAQTLFTLTCTDTAGVTVYTQSVRIILLPSVTPL